MSYGKFVRSALLASAGAAGLIGPSAFAQNAPAAANSGGGLEEIIVTARKQSETLLTVPVAVSAIGGEEIQRKGVTDLTRIAQLAPQIMLAQADSGTGASFSIRGLGTSFLDPGLEQSVVVVLDGAPISRGLVVNMGMFDLAQVEVMKGPQALFFGKNSPAGVVSLTSAGGTDTLEGHVRVGYEFKAKEKFVEAAISGPLSDTLKGRIAIRASDMRGWMVNAARSMPAPVIPGAGEGGSDIVLSPPFYPASGTPRKHWAPNEKNMMGRATLTWEPSSNFDSTLKVSFGDMKNAAGTTQQYCDPALGAGPVSIAGFVDPNDSCKFNNVVLSNGVPQEFVQDSWYKMKKDGSTYARVKTLLSTLSMNYKTDNLTISSVSSYLKLRFTNSNNYDQTSYGLAGVTIGEYTDIFSQEMRMVSNFDAPVNFTVGGYYEKMKRKTWSDALIFFVGPVPAGSPGAGRFDNFFSVNHAKGETISAFGQVRWNILENLELAGGVRYTKEKRTQQVVNEFIHPYVLGPTALGDLVPVGIGLKDGTFKGTNWSPEATLTYKITPQVMTYAAFKTGYKSGGFPSLSLWKLNPSVPGCTTTECRIPRGSQFGFGPEKAKGFEAGVKGKFANNTIRLELTAYSYKYSNLQQSIFDPPTFSFLIKNAASAKIKGIELSGEWLATEGLRFNGSVAYNDAKYSKFPNNGCYTAQTAAQGCVIPPAGTVDIHGNPILVPVQDMKGRRLPRAPKMNILAGVSYDTAISDGWKIGISGDVNYTSGYNTQETQPDFAWQKSYALWNAGLRVYSEDDKYELALIGRNLANKYYVQVSTATTFGIRPDNLQAATPRPREIRLQGTYRF